MTIVLLPFSVVSLSIPLEAPVTMSAFAVHITLIFTVSKWPPTCFAAAKLSLSGDWDPLVLSFVDLNKIFCNALHGHSCAEIPFIRFFSCNMNMMRKLVVHFLYNLLVETINYLVQLVFHNVWTNYYSILLDGEYHLYE